MADAGQDLQQLIQNYHECRATLVNHDTEQAQAKATWEEAKTQGGARLRTKNQYMISTL